MERMLRLQKSLDGGESLDVKTNSNGDVRLVPTGYQKQDPRDDLVPQRLEKYQDVPFPGGVGLQYLIKELAKNLDLNVLFDVESFRQERNIKIELKNVTPAKALDYIFLQDETAQIAIQSALTGHLVFTTVHANNVIDVIGRFINMGVEPYNFVSALNCVLAQRLVRLLCPVCKRTHRPTEQELVDSGLRAEEVKDQTFYLNVGCDACNHTGYRGRTAIHELLDMSDAIREMIIDRRPGSEIRRQAEKEGLSSLRESAVKKVFSGTTTLHEINRVTFVEEIK
jgi:hypothetical protein